MGKLKERVFAVISERAHTIRKLRSRYSQRRQGMGLSGRSAGNDTAASRNNRTGFNQIVHKPETSDVPSQFQDIAQEMAAVDEVARIITSTLDIDLVYEQFVAEVKKLVEFDRIGINVIDQPNGAYIRKYATGLEIPDSPIGVVRCLEGTLTEHLVQTHQTVIRPDLSNSTLIVV